MRALNSHRLTSATSRGAGVTVSRPGLGRPAKAAAALIAGAAAVGGLTSQADMIDTYLAKLPAGQITCDQASRYWTNTADYNSKVAQARAVAAIDPRGPQILAALGRIDEAANRCGLKGTVNAGNTGNTGTTGNQADPGTANPATPAIPAGPASPDAGVAGAAAPGNPAAVQILPGVTVVNGNPILVTVGTATFTLPNLYIIVRDWLAGFGIRI